MFILDVDPKSILCVFFKQGMCTKGDKCKWSHDLEIERKAEKRNIYCDVREKGSFSRSLSCLNMFSLI